MDPHLMYLAAAAATAAVVYVKRELVRDYVEHLVHPDGSSKPAQPSVRLLVRFLDELMAVRKSLQSTRRPP